MITKNDMDKILSEVNVILAKLDKRISDLENKKPTTVKKVLDKQDKM
jgi:hypothetical protein